jgi:hypothetical protein
MNVTERDIHQPGGSYRSCDELIENESHRRFVEIRVKHGKTERFVKPTAGVGLF